MPSTSYLYAIAMEMSMALPLTEEMLCAAYDFLCTTPPFKRWNLPDGEDIKFNISRSLRNFGHYEHVGPDHVISLSANGVGHTTTLMRIMAHEMIHLHEELTGMARPAQHTRMFWKLAARVCHFHGFDLKSF